MTTKSRAPLITFILILSALLIFFLKMVHPFLISVMMGAIIALLTEPIFKKLTNRKVPPKIAALLISLTLTLALVISLIGFAARAIHQGMYVGSELVKNENLSYQTISERLAGIPMMESALGNQPEIEEKIRESVKNVGHTISERGLRFVEHTPELLLHTLLALFASFVFLLNGRALLHWMFSKIPMDRDVEHNIKTSTAKSSRSVILSVLAAAVSETIIMFIAFISLGVPGAFFAGAATFIFSFIPIVSCSPVWLSGALYLYLHGLSAKALGMVAFGILAGIAENLVRPLVLRGSGNMHPLLSLISIFGGLEMFGLFGVILGPMVAALLVSLLNIWPSVGERSGLHFGETSL